MKHIQYANIIPKSLLEASDDLYKLIEAYYKYRSANDLLTRTIEAKTSISKAIETFIDEVRNDLGAGFVSSFIADEEIVFSRINDFYITKGSTNSIEFLFLVVFGKSVNVFYPDVHTFRSSNSKWSNVKSVIIYFGNSVESFKNISQGDRIFLKNAANQVFVADILLAKIIDDSHVEIKLIDSVLVSAGIDIVSATIAGTEYAIKKTLGLDRIANPGYGFRVGAKYHVVDIYANGTTLEVARVDSNGSILELNVLSYGVGYRSPGYVKLYPEDWESNVDLFPTSFESQTDALNSLTSNFNIFGNDRYAVLGYFAEDYTYTYTLLASTNTSEVRNPNVSSIPTRPRFIDLIGRMSDEITIYCEGKVFRNKSHTEYTDPNKYLYRSEGGVATVYLKNNSIQTRQGYYVDSSSISSRVSHFADARQYNPYVYGIGLDLERDAYEAAMNKTLHPLGTAFLSYHYVFNTETLLETDPYYFELIGLPRPPIVFYDETTTDDSGLYRIEYYAVPEYFLEDYALTRTSLQ